MAEDDNFDIDIYGDDANQDFSTITEVQDASAVTSTDNRIESDTRSTTLDNTYEEASGNQVPSHDDSNDQEPTSLDGAQSNQTTTQAISSTIGSDAVHSALPKQAPVQQGVKRKEGSLDEREIAPGATSALLVSELHWYQDEDDVRGWANQANVEDEIREITFNEHKVNGKSKGSVKAADAFTTSINNTDCVITPTDKSSSFSPPNKQRPL